MIKVETVHASKGGNLVRQAESLEKAKVELQKILNSAKRVISQSQIETASEVQFIVVVES